MSEPSQQDVSDFDRLSLERAAPHYNEFSA